MEGKDDILRRIAFVDQIIEVRRIERILVDKNRVGISCTDAVQREVRLCRPIEPIDGRRADSVAVQNTSHRFARSDFAVFDAVIVRRNAVEQVLFDDLFGLLVA